MENTISQEQKIEAIRQAVITVNPEIMELKFGCVGIQDGTKFVNLGDRSWQSREGDFFSFTSRTPEKILGRPIRLADVLWAIKVKMESGSSVFVPEDMKVGILKGDPKRNMLEWLFECWFLNRDDLTLQGPATIDFIYSTLV